MEFPTTLDGKQSYLLDTVNSLTLDELKFLAFGLLVSTSCKTCDCGDPECDAPEIGDVILAQAAKNKVGLEVQKLLIRYGIEQADRTAAYRQVHEQYVAATDSN